MSSRGRSLYEGGIRVPFIAMGYLVIKCLPNRNQAACVPMLVHAASSLGVPAGVVDNSLLGGVDWFPTVAALAKAPLSPALITQLDGQDMSAVSPCVRVHVRADAVHRPRRGRLFSVGRRARVCRSCLSFGPWYLLGFS